MPHCGERPTLRQQIQDALGVWVVFDKGQLCCKAASLPTLMARFNTTIRAAATAC